MSQRSFEYFDVFKTTTGEEFIFYFWWAEEEDLFIVIMSRPDLWTTINSDFGSDGSASWWKLVFGHIREHVQSTAFKPPFNSECALQQSQVFCIEVLEDGIVEKVVSIDPSSLKFLQFCSSRNKKWKVVDTIYIQWSTHNYTLNCDELWGSQINRTARYWTL
jgi:hypothetical protein